MATTKVCPKCGSNSFTVFDRSVRCYVYIVTNGYVEADGDTDYSEHVKTTCVCDECGHKWHPRRLNDNFIIDE